MRILALDIAPTAIGWAFGEGREPPRFGVYHPPRCGENLILAAHEFRKWLHGRISVDEPKLVAIEKPIHVPTNDLKTLRLQYGLPMVAWLASCDRSVPYQEYGIDDVRKCFLGADFKKLFKGRDQLKAGVVAECRNRGWDAADHNAGDALAVLDRARVEHVPGFPSRAAARLAALRDAA